MKGVDIEDEIWYRGIELSLDKDQGHEHLQRQEEDHVVPCVLHSDGTDSSCMVPKTKGASRHMHLISEMHLMVELRQWCTNSSERRVFRVCASKLASDESLGHQHIRVVYHRGRSQIASTSESHGGDLIIQ
ncbi:hypothetical protein GW17_00060580, partial [Ensete ventricosum]